MWLVYRSRELSRERFFFLGAETSTSPHRKSLFQEAKKRQRRDKQQHRASEAPPYVCGQTIIKPCKGASRSRANAGFRPYRAQCFFFSGFVGRRPTLLLTAPLALVFLPKAKTVDGLRS